MSYFTGIFGIPPYANLTVVETEAGRAQRICRARHDLPGPARHRQAGQRATCWPTRCRASGGRNWFRHLPAITSGSPMAWPPIPNCCGPSMKNGPAAMEYAVARRDGGSAYRGQRADHPVRAPGRLFARIVGSHRQQGRGCAEHAALRHRRREFLQDAQGSTPSSTPGNPQSPTTSARWRKTSPGRTWATSSSSGSNPAARPNSSWNTPFSAPQKGFRVMGKISQDLDTFRMPVDLQDRNRRQSRREAGGSGRHLLGILRGYLRQAQERRHRSRTMRAALQPADARRGGHPPRRAVHAELSEFADALKRISEGAGNQPQQFPGALPHRRSLFPAEQLAVGRQSNSAKSLNGDLEPKWTEVWGHINLGKIFDITGQRDRAVNEYNLGDPHQRQHPGRPGRSRQVPENALRTPKARGTVVLRAVPRPNSASDNALLRVLVVLF